MSHSDETHGKVVPAQLNFLALYNPTFADCDERELDQIVFYYSRTAREREKRRSKKGAGDDANSSNNAANEQLRQVGLAQGMVAFARDFSNGQPVDSVETEKHRIVLKELETGWWILASIDLTRLPRSKPVTENAATAPVFEYSSREVSPPALLLQQLQCAHRIFLLHHGRNLDDLFARLSRDKFCAILDRFWSKFASSWDVMLHGNPSVDVYGGIKLAAGGELGIGVGEEDWGSGERDVLEALVRNTDGLVDLTVLRFGDAPEEDKQISKPTNSQRNQNSRPKDNTSQQWMGHGQDPGPADGMIFSGIGMLTRPALRTLTDWIGWIYTYGEDAYGVRDNPSSTRTRRKRTRPQNIKSGSSNLSEPQTQSNDKHDAKSTQKEFHHKARPDIPPPIITAAEESLKAATASAAKAKPETVDHASPASPGQSGNPLVSSEQWVKILTLGYGSVWGTTSNAKPQEQAKSENGQKTSRASEQVKDVGKPSTKSSQVANRQNRQAKAVLKINEKPSFGGRFILGLKGNLDIEDEPDNLDNEDGDSTANEESDWSSRISLRTLQLDVVQGPPLNEEEHQENEYSSTRLRAVIYAHPPFIYTFLFDSTNMSLSMPSYFHDLHHHLTPLHGTLLKSTSPATVTSRLQSTVPNSTSPIYDLVHSPRSLATRCSIPNIPSPGTLAAEGLPNLASANSTSTAPAWSRVEALNVHSQILNTYADTRKRVGEHERTAKTARAWWVVWMRVPTTSSTRPETPRSAPPAEDDTTHSEAILVRKANDHLQPRQGWMGASSSSNAGRRVTYGGVSALSRLVGRDSSGSSPDASVAAGAGSSGKLAEGIGLGVEPRRYVEVLLSLCR